MELDLLRVSALVLKTPYYVVYAFRCKIHRRFHAADMDFASTLVWNHANTQTHTQSTQDVQQNGTDMYFNTTCYPLTVVEWITHWYLIRKVYNAFVSQKLLTCKTSRICGLDLIRLSTSFKTQRRLTEIV